jgi:hypothetical protein
MNKVQVELDYGKGKAADHMGGIFGGSEFTTSDGWVSLWY